MTCTMVTQVSPLPFSMSKTDLNSQFTGTAQCYTLHHPDALSPQGRALRLLHQDSARFLAVLLNSNSS